MKPPFVILSLLLNTLLYGQTIRDDFNTVNGLGDYQITPSTNTGSHSGEMCYNLTGGYSNNVYYEAISPIYDFSSWEEVQVQFKVVSSLRTNDIFAIYYLDDVDNNWYGWNLSNLNGTYTVTIPVTASRISFDLNTNPGTGNTSGRYAHVDWVEITNNIALPITLVSFTGEVMDRYNLLQWTTLSEQNNDYFTLYQSYDGVEWTWLDETPGQGNSSIKYDYTWRDFNWQDTTYYKLTQTDYDGKSTELGIVLLKRKTDRVIKVYNIIGQEMDWCTNCVVLELMESGRVRKRYKTE
jgi:hypothetical protein